MSDSEENANRRLASYKNQNETTNEAIRDRKKKHAVELRKSKRTQRTFKRRNLHFRDVIPGTLPEGDEVTDPSLTNNSNKNDVNNKNNHSHSSSNHNNNEDKDTNSSDNHNDDNNNDHTNDNDNHNLNDITAPKIEDIDEREYDQQKVSSDHMEKVSALLNSNDHPSQLQGAKQLRLLFSRTANSMTGEDLTPSMIPRIVTFLKCSHFPALQYECAWIVTNLACLDADYVKSLVSLGVVGVLIDLLSCTNESICEQAVWALGNIAGDNIEYRDYILTFDVISPLLAIVNKAKRLSTVRNVTWTVANLCRRDSMIELEVAKQCLSALSWLLYSSDDIEIVTDSCWAVSNLCDGSEDRIQAIIDVGLVRRLVDLLGEKELTIKAGALKCISAIVSGNCYHTQVVLNCGALNHFLGLLKHDSDMIRNHACLALSNICVGPTAQIQAVIDARVIPQLLLIMELDILKNQSEALWCVSNILANGNKTQMSLLLEEGALKVLCKSLKFDFGVEYNLVVLDALEKLVHYHGLSKSKYDNRLIVQERIDLTKLDQLRNHDNTQLARLASSVYKAVLDSDNENPPCDENMNVGYHYQEKSYLPKQEPEPRDSSPYSYYF